MAGSVQTGLADTHQPMAAQMPVSRQNLTEFRFREDGPLGPHPQPMVAQSVTSRKADRTSPATPSQSVACLVPKKRARPIADLNRRSSFHGCVPESCPRHRVKYCYGRCCSDVDNAGDWRMAAPERAPPAFPARSYVDLWSRCLDISKGAASVQVLLTRRLCPSAGDGDACGSHTVGQRGFQCLSIDGWQVLNL